MTILIDNQYRFFSVDVSSFQHHVGDNELYNFCWRRRPHGCQCCSNKQPLLVATWLSVPLQRPYSAGGHMAVSAAPKSRFCWWPLGCQCRSKDQILLVATWLSVPLQRADSAGGHLAVSAAPKTRFCWWPHGCQCRSKEQILLVATWLSVPLQRPDSAGGHMAVSAAPKTRFCWWPHGRQCRSKEQLLLVAMWPSVPLQRTKERESWSLHTLIKQISEYWDTISCHLSYLLCLYKWLNQYKRLMLSQSEHQCSHLGKTMTSHQKTARLLWWNVLLKRKNNIINHNKW